MDQYIKDNRIINATEKAYNTIYKEQGFTPYSIAKNDEKDNGAKPVNKMNKDELTNLATKMQLDISNCKTNADLVTLIEANIAKNDEKDNGANE